jgi:hypothetical protein
VQHRDPARAGDRHRQAVGGEDKPGDPRLGQHLPVDLLQPIAWFLSHAWRAKGTTERSGDGRAGGGVDLAAVGDPVGR